MKNNRYDIIIIGGGIIGTTLAFELAKRKTDRILLVEKSYITAGATGRCNAMTRRFWASRFYLDIVEPSIEIYRNINSYTGYDGDCEFTETGYMFPLYSDESLDEFSKYVSFQNSNGVSSEIIDAERVKAIVPGFNTDGMVAAAWNADDCHVNPFQCTFAFRHAAVRSGVEIMTGTEVLGILCQNGNVRGVRTTAGVFESECVFDCTNVGVLEIGKMVGDEVPVSLESRQTLIAEKTRPLGNGTILPMIVDVVKGTWIKQCPNGTIMLGKADSCDGDGLLDWDFMTKSAYENIHWMPEIRKLKVIRQFQGFYDNSPDHAPFIQYSKNAKGLFHIAGFSGHGFMLAPEFCKIIAQHFCGEQTDMPYDILRADRFANGDTLFDPLSV